MKQLAQSFCPRTDNIDFFSDRRPPSQLVLVILGFSPTRQRSSSLPCSHHRHLESVLCRTQLVHVRPRLVARCWSQWTFGRLGFVQLVVCSRGSRQQGEISAWQNEFPRRLWCSVAHRQISLLGRSTESRQERHEEEDGEEGSLKESQAMQTGLLVRMMAARNFSQD